MVGEHVRNWDLLLPRAEFVYNSSVNRSTGLSPFKVVHGYRPRKLVDLIPLPEHARISKSTSSFAEHIRSLHKEISDKINLSNQVYKYLAYFYRRVKEFNEGDYVMIRIRPERFSSGTVQKLNARGVGPFKILKRVGSNVYVIDLLPGYGISPTFNVSDLIEYKEPVLIPSDPFELVPSFKSELPLECL